MGGVKQWWLPADVLDMAHEQPRPAPGLDELAAAAAARSPDVPKAVHPLGRALRERVDDVVRVTGPRIKALGHGDDPVIQANFEAINRNSTLGLAAVLAGEGIEVAAAAGRESGTFYGQLAARRAASLQEIISRVFCWRDSVAEVLQKCAFELDASPGAVAAALAIMQRGLEASLVRMAASFDSVHQQTDEELAFAATHDALTGLPEPDADHRPHGAGAAARPPARRPRRGAVHRSGQLQGRSTRPSTTRSAIGLLRAVAERLDGVVRDTDALGRVGGDEFVVIAEELSIDAGPELLATRLHDALKAPFELDDATSLTVTASVGIARDPRSAAEELIRDADIAMYQAQAGRQEPLVVFDSEMHDAVHGRMELEMDLRDALANDEFFLVYQPTFNLADLRTTGVEALIRWHHPQPGHRPARRLHSPARVDRPDRRGRCVGAAGGLPPGRRLARGRTSDRRGRQRVRHVSSTPTG